LLGLLGLLLGERVLGSENGRGLKACTAAWKGSRGTGRRVEREREARR